MERAEDARRRRETPLNSAEGLIRRIAGWRVHEGAPYRHFGEGYRGRDARRHHPRLPEWFPEPDADAVAAHCLSGTAARTHEGRPPHPPADDPRQPRPATRPGRRGRHRPVPPLLRRRPRPGDVARRHRHLPVRRGGGRPPSRTPPYTSGGARLHPITDRCGPCPYRPDDRTGERPCPVTSGYRVPVHRHRALPRGNHRTARAVAGPDRPGDPGEVPAPVRECGDTPP
ncbi:hypothetical protein FOE67_26860 [Streptomyces calidiresistens]|uniref:Uncharacterized protein n=1 Tax=Streptomyces calidiresistens TaxID=1485586 RepID=A0A7W3T8T5_9ACTN|nr:hypothetical protein [Streptomyces calidiresistens]